MADHPDHDAGSASADRIHRATIEFGLDPTQAEAFEALVGAASEAADELSSDELDDVLAALDDPTIAEAAWTRWGDLDMLGPPLDAFVARLVSAERRAPA